MGELNKLLFKMMIHLYFESSCFKLFYIFLYLYKHLVGCINLMLIVK